MPRIRQYADRDSMQDFLAEVKAQAARIGCSSQKSIGEALGLAQGTIGNYFREPERIRLDNLKNMCKVLKLDPIMVLKMLGYSAKDIKKSYRKEFDS